MNNNWTREETIIAFNVYCKIPFKDSNKNHPMIIKYANIIGRSPSALNMKVGNLGRLDPKLKEKGITTYTIRQKALIPQGTLAKLKMCSGASMEEIERKLQEYKDSHDGKDFMCDVSTKTIEDICQLLQCQPQDLIEWKVDLNPELSYENRFKE